MDATNEFIASSEPWVLAKRDDPAPLDAVLWSAAEALRVAAVLLSPVMPGSSLEILQRVGCGVAGASNLRLDADPVREPGGERTLQRKDAMWPRLEAPADESVSISTKETRVTDQPKPELTPPSPNAPAAASRGALAGGRQLTIASRSTTS